MPQLFSEKLILDRVLEFLLENPQGVIEILGPTSSGKTGFSVKLAHFLESKLRKKSEIISVDSRQVYKGCDVCSAKITKDEMEGVIHHGLDLVDLNAEMSVVDFKRYGTRVIEEILERGNIPFLCGGTMLWLDAISENYIFEADKTKKSNKKEAPLFPVLKIGIYWDRSVLYDRINQKSIWFFENGLIEETKKLLEQNKYSRSVFTSIGYQEVMYYLFGLMTYEEALWRNQQRNRKYAKRQLTWWRGRTDVLWLDGKTITK